ECSWPTIPVRVLLPAPTQTHAPELVLSWLNHPWISSHHISEKNTSPLGAAATPARRGCSGAPSTPEPQVTVTGGGGAMSKRWSSLTENKMAAGTTAGIIILPNSVPPMVEPQKRMFGGLIGESAKSRRSWLSPTPNTRSFRAVPLGPIFA